MRRKWQILFVGRLAVCLVFLSVVFLPPAAQANISTGTLIVSAEISEVCSIRNITDVDFGLYNPLNFAPSDATGNFSFICLPGTAYELYISGMRQMILGVNALNYELYTDDVRATVWPGGTPSTETGLVPNADVIMRNVYARIPARQFVPRGFYDSFMTIVINF